MAKGTPSLWPVIILMKPVFSLRGSENAVFTFVEGHSGCAESVYNHHLELLGSRAYVSGILTAAQPVSLTLLVAAARWESAFAWVAVIVSTFVQYFLSSSGFLIKWRVSFFTHFFLFFTWQMQLSVFFLLLNKNVLASF